MSSKTTAHAYLITGGTLLERKEQACQLAQLASLIPKPDVTILQAEGKSTIGIDAIRKLTHKLSFKPHQEKTKKTLILEAQNLTVAAQNALLKTLEEPPGDSLIILTVPHTQQLLPTVISRCQITRLKDNSQIDTKSEKYQKTRPEFLDLLAQSRGERLTWSEKHKKNLSDRAHTQERLSQWLVVIREVMLKKPNTEEGKRVGKWVRENLRLLKLLESTNVSPRLVVEYFLISLPPNISKIRE